MQRTGRVLASSAVLLPVCALVLVTRPGRAAGDEPRTLGTFGPQCKLAFSPDGAHVAVTTRGGSAVLVELASGRHGTRYSGEEEERESALAFSPDGARLALATHEGRVRVFNARTGEEALAVQTGGPITTVAFSNDGKAFVTGGGQTTDLETEEVDAAAPTARVFDAESGALILGVDAESGNVASAVAASPAAPIVAVARADGKLTLLNLAEKQRRVVELGAPSLAVAFSSDGALVAAMGGKDGAGATLVDVKTGAVVRTLPAGNPPAGAEGGLAFSPDGAVLARLHPTANQVLLHSVETGKIQRALDLPTAGASIAFTPDGASIAVGLRTGDVLLLKNPLAR